MKKEKIKSIPCRRIPLTDTYIISGENLRWLNVRQARACEMEGKFESLERRFETLERDFKRLHVSNVIRASQIGKMQGRINVMAGQIPAPLCPKCGKPKTAGGIQWIDHSECFAGKAKDKSQKAKI